MSAPPQRCAIEYKYAVGIALKNRQPLRAKDVYDVMKVHMPRVCSYHSDNWQNAVRTCLSSSGLFEKVNMIKTPHEKPAWTYKFKEGAIEEFNYQFSAEYGAPYNFLTKPELHQKLYNGELGYPSEEEIRTARALFEKEKAKWVNYKKEKKTDRKSTTKVTSTGTSLTAAAQNSGNHTMESAGCDAENDIEIIAVLAPIQNQIPQQGNHGVNAAGPIRSQSSSTAWSRLTPYQRKSQVVRRKTVNQVQKTQQMPLQSVNVENQENAPGPVRDQPASTAWDRLTAEQRSNQIVRPKQMHQMEEFLLSTSVNQDSWFAQQLQYPIEQGYGPLPTPVVQPPVYSQIPVAYHQNPMPYYQNQAQWAEPVYPIGQGPQPIQMVPNPYAEPVHQYHQPAQNPVQQEEVPAEALQVAQQGAVSEEDLEDLFGVVVEEDNDVDYFLQNFGESADCSKKYDIPVLEELQIPNYEPSFNNPINNDPLAIAMDEIFGNFDLYGNY